MKNEEGEKTILIVTNDGNILSDVAAIFEQNRYHVVTAKTEKKVLDKDDITTYDLVLLDITMPDINGAEFLAKLQKIRPDMIKILMTDYANLECAVESLTKGAVWYFIKPLESKKLFKVVAMLLQEQEAEKTNTINNRGIDEKYIMRLSESFY
ncbi:MAG: response regulator [Candidatus Bathyarchaeota archaeon]|nr:MAG: response regulator [Candidatus Bathyarchaeota archaeon]